MSSRFSLITAVAGVALLFAVPAWGQGTPVMSPDTADAAAASSESPQWQQALDIRSEAMNRRHELGESTQSTGNTTAYEQALTARGQGLNRQYGLGTFAPTDVISGDDHVRLDPADLPTVVPASSASGRDVEWPQLGIGFGFGILLMLGIALTVRYTRVPPLAH